MFGKQIAQTLCVAAASALSSSPATAAAPFSRMDFPHLTAGMGKLDLASDCDEDDGGGTSTTTGSETTSEGFYFPDGPLPYDNFAFGIVPDADALPEPIPANCHNEPPVGPKPTPEVTKEISKALEDTGEFCGWLPANVRIDCVADRMRTVARGLPRGGDYAVVRQALEKGARDLAAISRANDSGGDRKRFSVKPPDGSARRPTAPLREVSPDRIAEASAAAARVIEETQTVLLRSAENSRTRMAAFQEIAAALDSSKVLLRST